MTVTLRRSSTADRSVTAEIACRQPARQRALAAVGWTVGPASTGRYCRRVFHDRTTGHASDAGETLREAYRAVYGDRVEVGRWEAFPGAPASEGSRSLLVGIVTELRSGGWPTFRDLLGGLLAVTLGGLGGLLALFLLLFLVYFVLPEAIGAVFEYFFPRPAPGF
jgi:hypothetical protein